LHTSRHIKRSVLILISVKFFRIAMSNVFLFSTTMLCLELSSFVFKTNDDSEELKSI